MFSPSQSVLCPGQLLQGCPPLLGHLPSACKDSRSASRTSVQQNFQAGPARLCIAIRLNEATLTCGGASGGRRDDTYRLTGLLT